MEKGIVKKGIRRVFAGVLALGVMLSSCQTAGMISAEAAQTKESTVTQTTSGTERLTTNYSTVSATYKKPVYTGADVVTKIDSAITERDFLTTDDKSENGYANPVASLTTGDTITVTIEAPKDGLYWMGFDYLSYDSSILPVEFGMKVDGAYPFYESRSMKFETTWISNEVDLDRYGNEIVSLPTKKIQWESKKVMDSSYRYSEPLMLQLTAGSHELEITLQEGRILLGNITLSAPVSVGEYTGSEKAEGDALIVIEAEDFFERNDSSIHAAGEYDSALSELSATTTKLNIVDDTSYDKAGQRITYQFTVEKSGYYYIGMNYRQSEKNDFPIFMDYRIDGSIPNTAFQSYPLASSQNYKTRTLTDSDGRKLSVYLEAGVHTISLTINADNIRYALEAVDEIMSGIADLSLEVTKVVGTNNNKYRDIKITRYIPDITERMQGWVDTLNALAKEAGQYVGTENPEKVAAFAYLLIAAKQLQTLAKEPNDLVYRVGELATSSNSINTQIANFVDLINKNNIAIDRIYVYQEGAKLPKKLNFFQSIGMSLQRFFYSFFGQSYSASNTDASHIQVWVNRPRTYVEIMQKMIDEEFTPATGIQVDLAIMTDANKLILSNASDDTPDIATGINYAIPFDLAIRGALVDLTKFKNTSGVFAKDYREIFGRYQEGLLVPSVVGEGLYSLPETMNFYVMFYRTDVLEKLGLGIPETIDDLVAMLPDLQMRGLNVYYPTAVMTAMRNYHGTTPLMFQNGGTLYGETALDITVDDEAAVKGFTQLTELFTLYNLPVDVPNFYQHFRNGDLPIGIADFNCYNLILNAAPEIANSWDIALVPGVREDSGEINRLMAGGAESTVMFVSDDEREAKAWEYMSWWSSAEVQAEFGQRLQILYGDEYIWPTANLSAFEMLPYPTSDKDIILEQAQYILEAPRLLGGYMMEREVSNAFNAVVVDGKNLRSTIDEVAKTVKRETLRKLEEFGYVDQDGNILKEYYVPSVETVHEILTR